jgi:hypothetical protein
LVSSIRYFLQENSACSAKSCYIFGWNVIYFKWNCLCFQNAMCSAVFLCNLFLPGRNIVFYPMVIRSLFDMFTCV